MAQPDMLALAEVGSSLVWSQPGQWLLEVANKKAGIPASYLSCLGQKYERAVYSHEAFKKAFLIVSQDLYTTGLDMNNISQQVSSWPSFQVTEVH